MAFNRLGSIGSLSNSRRASVDSPIPGPSNNDEIEIVDKNLNEIGKQENPAEEDEEEQHLLSAEEPTWKLCHVRVTKKIAIIAMSKFILFIAMMSYISYQLLKYVNPHINRREYTNEVLIDTMPFAYIYFSYAVDYTDCNVTFGFYNGSDYAVTDEYDYYYINDWNMTMEDLYDYVDNNNSCRGVYIIEELEGSVYTYLNYLFIPSSCEEMRTGSKDFHYGLFDCHDNSTKMPVDGIVWYAANHREQLLYFDTIYESMYDLFWHECIYMRIGFDALFAPKWIQFDNQIDTDDPYYDRFDLKTDGMEIMSFGYGETARESDFVVSGTSLFRFHSGGGVGSKYIYVTEPSMDILDILGLAGGMYSTIDQVLNYIAFAAIWGFSVGFLKFGGLGQGAGPNQLLQKQLNGFLKKRDDAILKLTHRIAELENKDKVSNDDTTNESKSNNENSDINNERGGSGDINEEALVINTDNYTKSNNNDTVGDTGDSNNDTNKLADEKNEDPKNGGNDSNDGDNNNKKQHIGGQSNPSMSQTAMENLIDEYLPDHEKEDE